MSYLPIELATSVESIADLPHPDLTREEAIAEAKLALYQHRRFLKGRAECNPNWDKD